MDFVGACDVPHQVGIYLEKEIDNSRTEQLIVAIANTDDAERRLESERNNKMMTDRSGK